MRWRRPHPDLVVVLLAILGVASLALAQHVTAPQPEPLADALRAEGARVVVDARVLAVAHSPRARVLTLAENGTRATALAAAGDGPAPGDLVRVLGVVTELNDGRGLSAQRITVLEAAATRPLDPSDLARAPADHDGARVLVRGTLTSDGRFAGGGARLQLSGVPPPARAGDWLVAGTFRYHSSHAEYALEAETWSSPP